MSLYPQLVHDDVAEASAPPEDEALEDDNATHDHARDPQSTRLFQNQAVLDGHFHAPPRPDTNEPSAPSEAEAFQNHVLKQTLQEHGPKFSDMDEAKLKHFASAMGTEKGTNQLLGELQQRVDSPGFLATVEKARTTICLENADAADQVGFVPTDDVEWWTLVPKDGVSQVEESALDGPYVFVENSDVVDAMAEFIALSLARIPETSSLSSSRLQQMLSTTFGELREKGTLGKLWDWGSFLYTTYGWTTCAIGIYREPAMAIFVLRAVWSFSKWVLGGRPN